MADHNGDMTTTPHRTHIPALLAIVALAAILRAGVAAPKACVSRDGVWFVEMAKKLADDPVRHMRIETKQPGLSWVMLATHSAFGGTDTPESWQTTGTLIAGVGGVAVCALVYLLALRLFDPTTAIVAGIFAAFWPHGMQLSADVLSDMPHLALYLAALGILALGERPVAIWRWPLAGAIAGLAYWFRLEALGFLPAIAVWALVTAPRTQRLKAVGRATLAGIGFAVIAGPFVVLARAPAAWVERSAVRDSASESSQSDSGHHARDPSIRTAGARPFAAPIGGPKARSTNDRAITGPARSAIAGHYFANAVGPLKLPQRMAEEWARSGRYVFAALFLAGLLIRSTPSAARPLATLCGLIAIFQLLLVAARVLKYGELSSRYMLTAIALTIPWAAAAFVHLIRLAVVRSRNPSHGRAMTIWAMGWLLALAPMAGYGFRPVNAGRLTLREAGCWLRETAAPDDVILADDLNLSQAQYYADRI
ncbi:MAG: glycosyltransferase family 39 protein, partial [Phycisphaerales bacterium]|nr:glycosyltransferase family 39 protein [Phycisphaerales bacterium]